jgi:hypothetical protein
MAQSGSQERIAMFERFYAGFTAARDCWAVLRQDKKLLVLPFLSGLGCLVVLLSFILPVNVLWPEGVNFLRDRETRTHLEQVPPWFWAALFAFYFCNYFIIYFFNAALIFCTLFHFRNIPIRVRDGLRAATRRLPQLLGWALVSATVGLLLKVIETGDNRAGGLVGRLISGVLGTTWTVLTYFVVPVLVVERVGPLRAVGRSAQILRETWGEALGGRVGIGWFLLPFWCLGLLLGLLGFWLLDSVWIVGLVIIGLAVVYVIVLALVGSALRTILLSGLYLYATQNEIPEDLDPAILEQAFEGK